MAKTTAIPDGDAVADTPPAPPSKLVTMLRDKIGTPLAAFWFGREFRLVSALVAVTALAVLLGLGTWQMLRLQEKNLMLAQIKQGLQAAPADLRHTPPQSAAAWEKLDYHPVRLQGTWLATRHFKLVPRTYEEQVGFQLIVPLLLADGQVVLVDRGFVPDGAGILPPPENEIQVVRGVARLPETTKPRYAPENLPSRNIWVWLDLKAMGHEVGRTRVAPVVIYEDRIADRDSWPIGGQVPLPLHNRHKQYAVTWYCLALALLGVWIMASTPKPNQTDTVNQNEDMDPVARRGMYPEATD